MKKRFQDNGKGKGLKVILMGLLILVALAGIGIMVWNSVKKAVIRRSIVRAVREKSNGLYSLWYKKLDMDEVAGTLHIQKLAITYNMAVYKERESDQRHPAILVAAQVPHLYVYGIKTARAMLNREIVGRRIIIDRPVIEVILTKKEHDTSAVYTKDFYKQLLGKLEVIRMDTITINNATIHVRDLESKTDKFTANGVTLQLRDLIIDSVHGQDKNRLLFSSDVSLHCDSMDIRPKTDKYRGRLISFHFNDHEKTFTISKLSVIPLLGESEFARSFNVQKDRFDIDMENIRLANIDVPALSRNEVRADSLIIKKSSYRVYRDLSYPRSDESKVGKYPHQLLMKLPVPLLINHMLCTGSYVEYKERNPKSDKSGRVQFYDAYAYMRHVTNIPDEISRNNICTVNLRARLLNKAPLEATITFYLKDPEGKFVVKGNLGAINATDLNQLSEPMGLVKIDTGYIDRLSFILYGDNYSAHGKVILLYHDLKISILKKEKETNNIEKRPLASFAANLIVQNSNPGKNKKLREATVQYKRDTTRSFFNLVWKSIFTGVKETAGLKE